MDQTIGHCVSCHSTYDEKELTLEQRLIDDDHFCPKCFNEIMQEVEMPYLSYMGAEA